MWKIKIESKLQRPNKDTKWWSLESGEEETIVSIKYQNFRSYFNQTYLETEKLKQIAEMEPDGLVLNRTVYIRDIETRMEIESDEQVASNLDLRNLYEKENNIKQIFFRVIDLDTDTVVFERYSDDSK